MCVIETLADQIFIDNSGKKTVRQRYRTKRGKERYRYIALISCSYCGEDFVPTRRGVHKYCSSSCRSRACKERKNYVHGQHLPQKSLEGLQGVELLPIHQDKWSWMRTGENVVASGAVAAAQYLALREELSQLKEAIKQEISLSERRIAQTTLAIVDDRLKAFRKPRRTESSIDAQAFRKAEEML